MWEGAILGMLPTIQAYMDESCDRAQSLFAIGGFVGRSDAWTPLLLDWIARLQPRNLPHPIRAFHMTDCESGGGEFKDDLGWDLDSRRTLIIDLLKIICTYQVGMFGLGIPLREYNALETFDGVKLGRNQYHFLFQAILADLAIELEQGTFPDHETIAFFFDRNARYESWANDVYKATQNDTRFLWRRRIGTLTFGNKEQLRLLQVADIGAFETMKFLSNTFSNGKRSRRSLQKLIDEKHVWKLAAYDGETLKLMAEMKKEQLAKFSKKGDKPPK